MSKKQKTTPATITKIFKSRDYLNMIKVGEKVGEKLTKNQELILSHIAENKCISIVELSRKVGIAAKNIENNIAKLKKRGLLRRIGPAKGGYWEVR